MSLTNITVKISLPTLVNSQAVKLASPPHGCLHNTRKTTRLNGTLRMGSNFVLSWGGADIESLVSQVKLVNCADAI